MNGWTVGWMDRFALAKLHSEEDGRTDGRSTKMPSMSRSPNRIMAPLHAREREREKERGRGDKSLAAALGRICPMLDFPIPASAVIS